MRFGAGLTVVLCAAVLCAQTDREPELARATAEAARLRALVDAGAVPRAQLEKVEGEIADAEDAALLRRTLYGQELTEEQADSMIAAAERRLERRKDELAGARKLVEAGVASQLSLGTHLEQLDRSRKEYDLAVSRARLVRELTMMAKAEQAEMERAQADRGASDRFDGTGILTEAGFRGIETAFEHRFGHALPVSAMGDTAVHRALGFDHRNRVDVAVHPDRPEGVWLRQHLESQGIPYFAFRHAVPGKATGAHIHIGPGSTRLARSAAGAVSGS